MERRDLEAQVLTWLLHEKQYPRAAVQSEAVLGSRQESTSYRADFGVVDLQRSEFVALIEVKATRDHKALRAAMAQLLHYQKILRKPFLPVYLFFHSLPGSGRKFEISQILADGSTKEVYPDEFPTYQALVTGDKSGTKATQRVAAREAVDSFQIVCIGLSIVVAMVLGLDASGTMELSPKQLILAAIAGGLLMLPYAAKLKLLGVEFERHTPRPTVAPDV